LTDPASALPSTVLAHIVIEGQNVRLRPTVATDAEAAFPLVYRERKVLDWLCWQGPADVAELREAYTDWRALSRGGDNYKLTVEGVDDGRFLGVASLRFQDHPTIGDLGYWLGVPYHGRGFGRELVGLLVHIGFEVLGAAALSAEVFPGNEASVRILERNGFRLERRAPRDHLAGRGCSAEVETSARTADSVPDPLRPRDLFLMTRWDVPASCQRPTRLEIQSEPRGAHTR